MDAYEICVNTVAVHLVYEEITRFNFESEMAKKDGVSEPIRGFFDGTVSA